ncbi:MAG: hypothetical protein LBH08_00330 [Puniceicoccales bacterium]|jgi:putative protein kinase ArgK-like GTPase of G3E family|nr:hypothetical protein [Puniceicoccales bacterium]
MIKKTLLSLLISIGGMLNCGATVSEGCRDFTNQVFEKVQIIETSFLSDSEARRQLTEVADLVAAEMNRKPIKQKRTKGQKDKDSADYKKLVDAYTKIQKKIGEIPN